MDKDDACYPSVRSNHTAISIDGSVVIYGGVLDKSKLEDAFLLRPTAPTSSGARGVLAARLTHLTSASHPGPIAFAAGAELNKHAFVIFGGTDAKGNELADTHAGLLSVAPSLLAPASLGVGASGVIRVAPQSVAWTSEQGTASSPAARKCHVMSAALAPYTSPTQWGTSEPAHFVLMHGGCVGKNYEPLGDSWVLMPVSTSTTARLSARALPPGTVEIPRTAAASGRLIFGWVKPTVMGSPPSARWGHVLTTVLDRPASEPAFLLTGGYGMSTQSSKVEDLNDLFVATALISDAEITPRGSAAADVPLLRAVRITWSQVNVRGEMPPRRRLGGVSLPSGRLVVFGGFSKMQYFGDLWDVSVVEVLRSVGVPVLVSDGKMTLAASSPSSGRGTAASAPPPVSHVTDYSSQSIPIGKSEKAAQSRSKLSTPHDVDAAVDPIWALRLGVTSFLTQHAALDELWRKFVELRDAVSESLESQLVSTNLERGEKIEQLLMEKGALLGQLDAAKRMSADSAGMGALRISFDSVQTALAKREAEYKSLERAHQLKIDELDRVNRCIACEDRKKCVLTLPCKCVAARRLLNTLDSWTPSHIPRPPFSSPTQAPHSMQGLFCRHGKARTGQAEQSAVVPSLLRGHQVQDIH